MKNLLILGIGGKTWMGGVTYIKNMLFQITCIEKVSEKYCIFMLIPKENEEVYDFVNKYSIINRIQGECSVDGIICTCEKYQIDVIFPVINLDELWMLKDNALCWIPDFQEVHLPELFDKKQLKERELRNRY